MHPDLRISQYEITPWKSLHDFVDKEITPLLKRLNRIEDGIRSNTYPAIEVEFSSLVEVLRKDLTGRYVEHEEGVFRYVINIKSVDLVSLVSACGLEGSLIRVSIDGTAQGNIGPELDPSQLNRNSVVTDLQIATELPFRVSYIVDKDKETALTRTVSLRKPYKLLEPETVATFRAIFGGWERGRTAEVLYHPRFASQPSSE